MRHAMITVVTPVYQGEAYLAQSIESILSQTYADFHLAMVDDDSNDRSWSIIEQYARIDKRIISFRKQHSGVVDTLNHACRHTQSKYVALLDQDDIAMPSRLATQVAALESTPSLAAVGSFALSIDESGKPIRLLTRPARERGLSFDDMLNGNLILDSSAMMRRAAFDAVGGYRNLTYPGAEDYDLWLRMSRLYQINNLRSVLVQLRTHLHQASFTGLENQVLSAMEAKALNMHDHETTRDCSAQSTPGEMSWPQTPQSTTVKFAVVQAYLEYALLYERLGRRDRASDVLARAQAYATRTACEDVLEQMIFEGPFARLSTVTGK